MTAATLLVVGSTVLGVLAIVVVTMPAAGAPVAVPRWRPAEPGGALRLVAAGATTAVVLAASGWILPATVVGIGAWFAVGAWQRRDRRGADEVAVTDAIASWIESLRDVLIAGDQPIGAISATVASCPAPIRPHVRRLATRLGRLDPETALRRFADDLDDPLGDLVAAGLLISVQRGGRAVAVLDALAAQARHQADRRRIVDAERAPVRREVGLLTAIMGSLVLALLVLGRAEYLAPYDSASGQLFLGVCLALYGSLLVRVQRLARHPRPARFLTAAGATASGHRGEVVR